MKLSVPRNLGFIFVIAHIVYVSPFLLGFVEMRIHEGTIYGFIGSILEIPGLFILHVLSRIMPLEIFQADLCAIITSSIFYFIFGVFLGHAIGKHQAKISSDRARQQ